MEIAALTAFLAPFMPYLVAAGRQMADDAAHDLGDAAWGFAKRLWGKLHPKVEERPAAAEAATDVAERPDDERTRASFELQLEKLLTADPALAAEVEEIWKEAQAARVVVASGERSVAIGGDVTGSVISTGEVNPRRD